MNCHEIEPLLQDYIDETLADAQRRSIEDHLGRCPVCRDEVHRLGLLLDEVKRMPREMRPGRDLWPDIEARITAAGAPVAPGAVKQSGAHNGVYAPQTVAIPEARRTRRLLRWRWYGGYAAAAVLLIALGIWWYMRLPQTGWQIERIEGTPLVDAERLDGTGRLPVGAWVVTDARSQAQLNLGEVGYVDIEPNTRVRLVEARKTGHRLGLDRGTLHATIWAPPRLFFVETPSAVAIDLGCAYTLTVDDRGDGLLRVTAGWVELEHGDRKAMVPSGMRCTTRAGIGPGTPWAEDASEAFQRALARFDFEEGGHAALPAILAGARVKDALTLWHLLVRVQKTDRGAVYDRLASLMPAPAPVTREGILRLDAEMLDRWREWMLWYPTE
jgi:hypothetical protein